MSKTQQRRIKKVLSIKSTDSAEKVAKIILRCDVAELRNYADILNKIIEEPTDVQTRFNIAFKIQFINETITFYERLSNEHKKRTQAPS